MKNKNKTQHSKNSGKTQAGTPDQSRAGAPGPTAKKKPGKPYGHPARTDKDSRDYKRRMDARGDQSRGSDQGRGGGNRFGGRRAYDDEEVKIDFDAALSGRLPETKMRELAFASQRKLSLLVTPKGGAEGKLDMANSSTDAAGFRSADARAAGTGVVPQFRKSTNAAAVPTAPAAPADALRSGANSAVNSSKRAGGFFSQFVPSRSYLNKTEPQKTDAKAASHAPVSSDPKLEPKVSESSLSENKAVAESVDRGFEKARAKKIPAGGLFSKNQPTATPVPPSAVVPAVASVAAAVSSASNSASTSAATPAVAVPDAKSALAALAALSANSGKGRRTEGGIQLDPWQAEALDALLAGANVVVDAPTSAGKTRVIEALLEHKMFGTEGREGIKLIYTSPVKSLSNDKYREFCEKYGREKVGINTGDFKENLSASIILATLETYRNSLLGVEPNMNRRVVVYDEYHFLQDESRGSAWEESIILTPKESQLILLSASVPNAEDFANWIATLSGRECKVIRVTERPVPLVDLVYTKQGWVLGDDLKLTPPEIAELGRLAKYARTKRRKFTRDKFNELLAPVTRALEMNLGPVVIYAGRRADVEGIAHAFAKHLRSDFTGPDADKLKTRIANLPGWDYVPQDLQRLIVKHGVAFHHSGMIPPGRVAIETLLKEGLLLICTGTMGISLGVNFAVRSAMVSDESRPSEGGETRYSGSEVLQMLGRAGRRGHDKQGFSLWMNLARYVEQKPRGREPCRSSLKFDPTTVLGILGQRESFAYLSEFYRKSFFMRGKDPAQVMVADHDLMSANLYKVHGFEEGDLACRNIPKTFDKFQRGGNRSEIECNRCPAKNPCHAAMGTSHNSVLQTIVSHLQRVGALNGAVPTLIGQLARHFPQAGGLIIARFLATGEMNGGNFSTFLQAMAVFCAAHFKDISDTHADTDFLRGLRLPKLVENIYPEALFPELYDEPNFRGRDNGDGTGAKLFREYNMGAASIVAAWLNPDTTWDDLVADHTSKHFSAGDCMMVLFRFATFLQSCGRIADFAPEIADQARVLLRVVLREPLDARNRMLADEADELTAALEAEDAPEGVTVVGVDSEGVAEGGEPIPEPVL